jgi:hypothetical protein
MAESLYFCGWTGRFVALSFISLLVIGAKEMRLSKTAMAVSESMEAVINSLTFPDTRGSYI